MRIVDDINVAVEVVGGVHLYFDSFRKIMLKDIFVACLFKDGYTFTFNKGIEIYRNRSLIYNGWIQNDFILSNRRCTHN